MERVKIITDLSEFARLSSCPSGRRGFCHEYWFYWFCMFVVSVTYRATQRVAGSSTARLTKSPMQPIMDCRRPAPRTTPASWCASAVRRGCWRAGLPVGRSGAALLFLEPQIVVLLRPKRRLRDDALLHLRD